VPDGGGVRRLVIILALVAALAGAYRLYGSPTTATGSLTLQPPAPAPGDDAPHFSVRQAGRRTFALSERGTYVLAFWSRLNLGSERSEPYFRRLAEGFGGEGVRFAAVYVGGAPEGAGSSRPYAMLEDRGGRLASIYNVKEVPRLFLIRNGTVLLTYDDFYPEAYGDVREELEELDNPPTQAGLTGSGAQRTRARA
jgi:hypothetical protein